MLASLGSSPSSPIRWRRKIHQPWSVQAGARLWADHLFALESTGSTVSCHILTNYVFQYLRFFKGSRVSWHIWLNMYFQPRPDAKKLFFWECREHKCVEKLKMSELGILTSVQKKSVPRCVWGISTDLGKRIRWFVSGWKWSSDPRKGVSSVEGGTEVYLPIWGMWASPKLKTLYIAVL